MLANYPKERKAFESSIVGAGHLHEWLAAADKSTGMVDSKLGPSLQFVARIEAHAADRARGLNQSEALVFAQRLRVHTEHVRRHTDEKEILLLESHTYIPKPESIRVWILIRAVSTS